MNTREKNKRKREREREGRAERVHVERARAILIEVSREKARERRFCRDVVDGGEQGRPASRQHPPPHKVQPPPVPSERIDRFEFVEPSSVVLELFDWSESRRAVCDGAFVATGESDALSCTEHRSSKKGPSCISFGPVAEEAF